jgi:hypothetical protein
VARRDARLTQTSTTQAPSIAGEAPGDPPITTVAQVPVGVATISGVFVQAGLATGADTEWTLGLRADDYHLVPGVDLIAIEPRVEVRRKLSETMALTGGGAILHQAPTNLLDLPGAEVAGLRFGLQEAVHLNAGLEAQLGGRFELSAQLYFNPLIRTFELSPFDPDFFQSVKGAAEVIRPRKESSGFAYGAELFLRRRFDDRWYGWVSYSFQQSVRKDLHAPFEQAHVVNAVLSYALPRGFTAGASVHFNTGMPEAGGFSSITQREGVDEAGNPKWIPQDLHDIDRLPAYLRVDARIAKEWRFETISLEAFLDIQSIALTQEVARFSYQAKAATLEDAEAHRYRLEKKPSGSGFPPILPVAGVKGRY